MESLKSKYCLQRAGPFTPHWYFDPTLALPIGCYNLPKSQKSAVLDKGSVACVLWPPISFSTARPFLLCNCVRNQTILLLFGVVQSDKEFLYRNRTKIVYHPILSETVRKIIPEKILIQKGRKVHEFVRKEIINTYACVGRLNAITVPFIYYKIASEQ